MLFRIISITVLLPFILCCSPASSEAQQHPPPQINRSVAHLIDSMLQSKIDQQDIPGAVVLIKHHDSIVLRKAYGFANQYDFTQEPLEVPDLMTTNHLFDIASLTKVIGTTTGIMWLADQKKISIEDPISRYIPALDSGEKRSITIRHLLTHTAGLMEWYPLYYRSSDRRSTYQLIAQLPLKYPVGKERHYSDLGFTLLGQLIEIVSGQSLDEFLQEQIFKPLGMMHTLFNPKASGQAFAYAATSAGNPYEKRMVHDPSLGFVFKEIDPDQWNNWRMYRLQGEVNDGNAWYAGGGISGAAGLFSTVDDLQLLIDLLLHAGSKAGDQLISGSTIRQFLTQDNFNNGLGWMMDAENSFMKNAPAGSFGHTGFTGTSIVVVPECRLSVILLINRQNKGLTKKGEYINLSPLRQELFQTARLLCDIDKEK